MLNIIICDDDPVFRETIAAYLSKKLQLVNQRIKIYSYDNSDKISDTIFSMCDIALLDIDFKGKKYTGIDIAKNIRLLQPTAVIIFISNYIEFAPEGYEVRAFRYILKSEISAKLDTCIDLALNNLQESKSYVRITSDHEFINIPIDSILYIESVGHLLYIHALSKKNTQPMEYSCYQTLKNMKSELNDRGFLQIHKSFLVNINHIKKLSCNECILDTGTVLSVGSKSYAECKREYLLWKGSH